MKLASNVSQVVLGGIMALGIAGVITIFMVNFGDGLAVLEVCPIAFLLAIFMVAVTIVRCIWTQKIFPLVFSVVFLAGVGFDIGFARVSDALMNPFMLNIMPAMPWVCLAATVLGALMSLA